MKSYPFLAPILALLVTLPPPGFAQQPPTQMPAKPRPEGPGSRRGINVRILSGDGAINSLAMRTAVIPAIEVQDFVGNPIEGAEVLFSAPESGAGGVFANGTNRFATRTDARGQAVADFTPNTLPGAFVIRVEVKFEDQAANVAIRQTNDQNALIAGPAPQPRAWYKSWKWWAVIGGAGAAGAYFATRGTSDSPTITISPGAILIGGPR